MSYIGQTLPADTFQGFTTDSFTGDGSATTFTLSKAPFSENGLIVVINNVIQKPTTNFTVSGTTLTIVGTAVASGDVIYATHLSGVIPSTLASKVDVNGVSDAIILDADADTTISADTDDQIDFKAGNTDTMHVLNGDVRINTTAAIQPGSSSGLGVKGDINISDFTADTSSSALVFTKSRNTTPGSQTIVNDGDQVGAIFFKADDGDASDYNNNVAAITAEVNGTPGTNYKPGRLTFFTTADGERTNTQRMRIGSTGTVGIGMNNGTQMLSVASPATSGSVYLYYGELSYSPDDNTSVMYYAGDTTTNRFFVYSDGDVKNHDNSYGAISDERIKQDIRDSNSQWDDIKAVKVRNFKKKDDVRQYGDKAWEQIGVIAQELESAGMDKLIKETNPTPADIASDASFGTLYEDGDTIPEGKKIGDVKEIKEQVKGVSYSVLYMKAIKALQEAMAKIETLETKVKALEDA
jgi:hypothetical protein